MLFLLFLASSSDNQEHGVQQDENHKHRDEAILRKFFLFNTQRQQELLHDYASKDADELASNLDCLAKAALK